MKTTLKLLKWLVLLPFILPIAILAGAIEGLFQTFKQFYLDVKKQ